MGNEYRLKCGKTQRLGSKGRELRYIPLVDWMYGWQVKLSDHSLACTEPQRSEDKYRKYKAIYQSIGYTCLQSTNAVIGTKVSNTHQVMSQMITHVIDTQLLQLKIIEKLHAEIPHSRWHRPLKHKDVDKQPKNRSHCNVHPQQTKEHSSTRDREFWPMTLTFKLHDKPASQMSGSKLFSSKSIVRTYRQTQTGPILYWDN